MLSSTIDEIAGLAAGAVLSDRGQPVKIDRILDLGAVDFDGETLELWDPVQLSSLSLKLKTPGPRAEVYAALSGQCVRAMKLKFFASKVVEWEEVGETSGPFGTLVLSRQGPRAKVAKMTFVSSFWDEVFDEAFDPADGAAIVELDLEGGKVALVAWNDCQMGGTLFRGRDSQGRVVALLFDAVRISPED